MELDNFVSGCIAVEQTVASVYRSFMDMFPKERDFWNDLYKDEMDHSNWLTDISISESIDLLPSKDLLPSEELIVNSLAFVEAKLIHIKLNPVTFEEALKDALQLEELMVEAFTNELSANLFSSDYQSLHNRLIAAEKLHINKIEDMMISKGFMQLS